MSRRFLKVPYGCKQRQAQQRQGAVFLLERACGELPTPPWTPRQIFPAFAQKQLSPSLEYSNKATYTFIKNSIPAITEDLADSADVAHWNEDKKALTS